MLTISISPYSPVRVSEYSSLLPLKIVIRFIVIQSKSILIRVIEIQIVLIHALERISFKALRDISLGRNIAFKC